MKRKNIIALSLAAGLGFMVASCTGTSTPKASLKSTTDSISYAYGVSTAEQGLVQFLEQSGVFQSSSAIEYDYQMRITAEADSLKKQDLQKELKLKLDSLNKINAPKLDEFIKGLKAAINLERKSPYAQGLGVGIQFSQQMLPQVTPMLFGGDSTKKIDNNQLLAGLIDVLKNKQTAIEKSEAGTYIQGKIDAARAKETAKQEEDLKVQYKDSIAVGEKFLADNAKREGVVTLPSGLQYEIVKEGKGDVPAETDKVKVHYRGTLINGTVFDSSIERKEPAVFGVNQVIPGWTEALKLMPVGSKWKLYIPYNLAYGSRDQGTIKPFSTLIFDVELLGIEK